MQVNLLVEKLAAEGLDYNGLTLTADHLVSREERTSAKIEFKSKGNRIVDIADDLKRAAYKGDA